MQPPNPSTRSTTFKLVVTLLISFILFALPARFAGFGAGMAFGWLMLLVSFGAWLSVASILSARWASSTGQKVGVYLATLIAMVIFFQIEIYVLGLGIKHFLPRPVFHNEFVWHERAVLPFWYPEHPDWDEFGQCIQADHQDNLLVLLLTGVPEAVEKPWLWGVNTKEYSARVGTREAGKIITLPRTKDTFVLIRPDGTHRQFPLGPGLAERFHERAEEGRPKNLLRSARDILDPASQSDFDAFIANYQEPLPPRPVFHHEHGPDNPPMSPYWQLSPPRSDPSGNLAWADYQDNLLVIVKEAARSGQEGYRYYYPDHFAFWYREGPGSIEVPRAKDALIVVRPDGSTKQFPLGVGAAERYHKSRSQPDRGDLLLEAAKLLPKPVREEFEEFIGQTVTSASQPESQPAETKSKREPIYNEKADPQADIANALARARQANKRVLIIYGGNWCSWCYRFDDLLRKDPEISRAVEKSYEVVHVEAVKNPAIGERYGTDREKGYPYLTVLDANGKVLVNQETGVFEEGEGYRPAVVLEFFLKHRPEAASRPAA